MNAALRIPDEFAFRSASADEMKRRALEALALEPFKDSQAGRADRSHAADALASPSCVIPLRVRHQSGVFAARSSRC
jgi:hypothetical protein